MQLKAQCLAQRHQHVKWAIQVRKTKWSLYQGHLASSKVEENHLSFKSFPPVVSRALTPVPFSPLPPIIISLSAAPDGLSAMSLGHATSASLNVSWAEPAHANAPGPLHYSLQMRTSPQRPMRRQVVAKNMSIHLSQKHVELSLQNRARLHMHGYIVEYRNISRINMMDPQNFDLNELKGWGWHQNPPRNESQRGQRQVQNMWQNKERGAVHLICIHRMLPDNKLQFNPRRGGSHSVVINKWLGTCIIYQTSMPSSSSAFEISLFPDLFIHSSLLSS